MKKKKTKFSLGQALDNKRIAMAFSVVLAIIIWFIVTALATEVPRKIDNVPVTINTDVIYGQYGLSEISTEPYTVNVWVKGKTYKVGRLTADDFEAVATPTNISEAGIYDIEVKVSQKNFDSEYVIEKIDPAIISVQIGVVETKEFDLEVRADNISASSDDLVVGTPYGSASKVTVKGLREELEQVSKVSLVTEERKTISQTQIFEGELRYYDENDQELDVKNLETGLTNFEITVPILKRVTVALDFQYINKPSNFEEEELKPEMSIDEIEIAAPLDTAESLSSINLTTIDIRDIDVGRTFRFTESDIKLPAGCELISDIDEIVIQFPSEGMSSKTLAINRDNINIFNVPSNYDVTVVSSRLSDVKIVGKQEIIDSITNEDLQGVIDLSDKTLQTGNITVPVKVTIQKNGLAWAYGEYTILVSVRKTS